MSFAAPAFLLGLLVLPALAAAYVAWERRRRAAASAFASPALMAAVAPRRPGVRRHLPVLVYAAALAALLLALARPQTTVAVEEERASVVLVTDVSGSMEATDVRPTRLAAAREAALGFLERAPRGLRVGLVAFSDRVLAARAPTRERAPVSDLVRSLRPQGGTATGAALETALRSIAASRRRDRSERAARDGARRERPRRPAPAAIVLLSDGASTSGRDPVAVAREARRARVPIHTVALGTDAGEIEVRRRDGTTERRPVPPDRDALERIAQITGGETFSTADAEELEAVYERLGSDVATRRERRPATAAFAGGGALLALLGGFTSLALFGRLP